MSWSELDGKGGAGRLLELDGMILNIWVKGANWYHFGMLLCSRWEVENKISFSAIAIFQVRKDMLGTEY